MAYEFEFREQPDQGQEQNSLGFIKVWKVTNLGQELTAKLLDESLYIPFNEDDEQFGRYQVIRNFRPENSKNPVEGTLVLLFHPKRYKRDVAILNIRRDRVLAKAQAGEMIAPGENGEACSAKVKGNSEENALPGINEEIYAQRLAFCGHSAIFYRPIPNTEIPGVTPKEMAITYQQLKQMESCFRVMKDNRGLRPACCWDLDHTEGHLIICVLALMILRYIQRQTETAGQKLSVYEICNALKDAELVCWKDQTGKVCLHPVMKVADNAGIGREDRTSESLAEMEKQKKRPSTIDTILEVCGLQPLKSTYSRNELARCLNTKFYSDEAMLSQLVLAQMD